MVTIDDTPGPECRGIGIKTFSQTIPHPMDRNFFPVYEGILAWAAILTIALAFLVSRRISFLFLLITIIASTILSEAILVHVGGVDLQTRPPGNCIGGNGFPSGHTQQLTTAWTYLTFDTIFRPGWSVGKKIILLITWLLVFIPNGPSRWAVHDHHWFQIGAGYGIGFGCGLLGFLLVRFLVSRYLEDIMCLKIVRHLRFVNDYEPSFDHSRHKGSKHTEVIRKEKEETKAKPGLIARAWNQVSAPGHSKWEDLEIWQFILVTAPLPITYFVLGAVGIAASYWKGDLTPDCDISAPEILLATNALTIFLGGIACAIIAFGVYRYHSNEPDKHLIGQYLWLFFTANLIECYIWNFAGRIANDANNEANTTACPPGDDIGSKYVTAWYVIMTVSIFYFALIYFYFRLFTLYTSRVEMWPTDRTKKGTTPQNPARPPMQPVANRPDLQDGRTTTSVVGGTPVTKRPPFVPQQV
eukprot:TRINITY_DN14997_c0_g1_i1.p1 TRINITY_DN14997_c0_g1~~TRINITY_DN14997_c0_g1_i1.p1  ORF type:complete len:470 (+),score=70.28 TRINITY_DN14997_c0_g1_i1:73-1482(+)